MKARVSPTREKINIAKADLESDLDFLERLAGDIGFDFWIDDSEIPQVLHFEPPDARDAIEIGGKAITLGYGANTSATIRMSDFTIEQTIPSAVVSTTRRAKDGRVDKGVGESGVAGRIRVADGQELATSAASTAPQGGVKQRNERILDGAVTKSVLAFTMNPGVPWWNLNQLVPVVDLGDFNAIFRFVDITDDVGPKGYEMSARAVLGGGKASKKQQKGQAGPFSAGLGESGVAGRITVEPGEIRGPRG